MITITRLNDKELIINCEQIESVEATPDTMITMSSGRKYIAKENTDEIIDRMVSYKRRIHSTDDRQVYQRPQLEE
jgi:flagellar protein FlbD